MRAFLFGLGIVCSVFFAGFGSAESFTALQSGDIVFQISLSEQSEAIQLATHSEYTHCGIIFEKNGELFVFEAIATVRFTPLKHWIQRGENEHYIAMRLKDASVLTPVAIQKLGASAAAFAHKTYDILFQWSDTKIYCSELVWKIYKQGIGIELSPLRTFQDYALNHAAVQEIIKQRYGVTLRLDEQVVAPSDLMESPLLEIIQ